MAIISRGTQRFEVRGRLTLNFEEGEAKTFQGTVVDLSDVGCGIVLKESVPADRLIKFDITADFLSMHLSGTGKIVNVAQKKYSTDYRIGVKFTQIDKAAVMEFINANRSYINAERRREEAARKKRQGVRDLGQPL